MPFAAMGALEILIIPAIALVIWLVTMLFRNQAEPPNKNRRPTAKSSEEPRRQTSSDLDRFISDARRQREEEERRTRRPAPPARPQRRPVLLEVEDEPPPRLAPRPPVAAPRPAPQRPMPRMGPVTRPVEVPVLELAQSTSQAPVMQSIFQPALPVIADQPAAPVDMLKREVAALSPLLLDVREMLSGAKSAQMAFALREVFDVPLCRRRRP